MAWLIILTGYPCSGKTSVAEYISKLARIPNFSKDQIIEILFKEIGLKADNSNLEALRNTTYELLWQNLYANLSVGTSVVVDSNFNDHEHTEKLLKIATETSANVLQIFCEVEPAVAWQYFTERQATGKRTEKGHPEWTREEYFQMFVEGVEPKLSLPDTHLLVIPGGVRKNSWKEPTKGKLNELGIL